MTKIETALTEAQARIAETLFAATYAVTLGKREGNPTTLPIPMADMPASAWHAIVSYGAQRKFNDAVGGSDVDLATKIASAQAMIGDFIAGRVGRQTAVSTSPLEVAIRNVLRGLLVAKMDATQKAAWTALEAADRNKQLDARFAGLPEATQAKITAKARADIAEAAKRAAEAKALADDVGDIAL
jgi:hypothetical protein